MTESEEERREKVKSQTEYKRGDQQGAECSNLSMTPPRLLPPPLKPFLSSCFSSSLLHFHPRLPPLHPSCLNDPLPLSGRLCVPFSSGRLLHSFTSSLASQASVSLFPLVISFFVIPLLPCITLIFALRPASLHHPALLIFLFSSSPHPSALLLLFLLSCPFFLLVFSPLTPPSSPVRPQLLFPLFLPYSLHVSPLSPPFSLFIFHQPLHCILFSPPG